MRYLLAALLLALASFPAISADDYGSAKVSRVTSIYDGDTFRADIQGWPAVVGSRVPVRLDGVDTPEMRGKCQAEKDKARQAKQFTVAKLRNAKTIELRHINRGKYFRLVAEVWVDGQSLGPQLLKAGLAVPYGGGHKGGWCG